MEGLAPERALADLRELARRTGGAAGARRVAWTDGWAAARSFLGERLAEIGLQAETDAAGNLWALLRGRREELVVVGSHLDSVPAGGPLDGALGVMAALECLRALAQGGAAPERSVALVDWADEEGARFGRSLLGSSAFAGTLDAAAVRDLRDADGVAAPEALARFGVEVEAMAGAGAGRRELIAAYLELHIEQGPVLEAEGLPCAAVLGCSGVERGRAVFCGRAGHAGSTPMDRRADAGVAAARAVVGLQEIGRRHGGVCTAGRVDLHPGIVTAVAGRAEVLVDMRHLDPGALAAMTADAARLWKRAAAEEGCSVEWERVWSIEPVPFSPALVEAAAEACEAVSGTRRTLASGALHDAAELARVAPAAMVFAPSAQVISHSPQERTADSDLAAAIRAFGLLVAQAVDGRLP